MRKKSALSIGLLAFCLGFSPAARASSDAAVKFARYPYLQLATPDSIWVVWRTEGPISPGVRFGAEPDRLTEGASAADIVARASLGEEEARVPERWRQFRTSETLRLPKLHSAPIGTFQYEAKLSGLKPATRYYYAVYDGDRRLTPVDQSYSFVTPPPVGSRQPFRFWVLGDSGTGRQPQADVHRAMIDFVKRTRPLDFWIHVGDMAYGDGRDMEFQSRFFESYEPTLRSSVCWPTMGNHEGHTSNGATGIGPYYDAYVVPTRGEAGGLASGTEAYYAFDYANVHFICLNSHDLDRKPSGAMAKWLKADLEKAKADWIIAFWHHPPYTKGSHDSDKERQLIEMRQHILPILESGGVDVVLTGHSHIYERSMLMDGAYAATTVAENVILDDGDGDPNGDGAYLKSAGIYPNQGTVQVVAGHGGANLSRKGTMPVMKRSILEWGSVIIDVDGDTLTGTMLNRNGKERDFFSLIKRGRVQQTRLALPWQPPTYEATSGPRNPSVPPVDHKVLIPRHSEWRYLVGRHPQGRRWTQPGFDDSGWKKGIAGFGVGDCEFRTELTDAGRRPTAVYLRREFEIEQPDKVTELGLWLNYLDGFVAYVNGQEVARSGIGRSSGRNVQNVRPRERAGFTYVTLRESYKHLRAGTNILSIEAHVAEGGLDLCIDPALLLED